MSDEKLQVGLRAATDDDTQALIGLDHGYATEYVWQMEVDSSAPRMGARFREARLPRAMQVAYPRTKEAILTYWKDRSAVLLAESSEQPVGYAAISGSMAPGTAWVTDLVVAATQRRKGVGTRLLLAAQNWAREHGHARLMLEMQSKNHPAIKMAQKLAFEFAGYNERYYDNQDIVLFFAKRLA